jgi:flagellar basal-body rod modification protein FlgD
MQGVSGDQMKIKTEWMSRPDAPKKVEQEFRESASIGKQLNELSGISDVKDPFEVTKKKELDKDAFLKMFMTQLKYQDPTSPVDNEKMAQQMAMFSQLEQSVTTNQYLEKMLAKQGDESSMAFNLIGKTVSADQASLFHSKLENTQFSFKLPQDASELNVEIINELGETIKTIPMDKRVEGEIQVRWDGKTDDGGLASSGRYFYKVNAKDMNDSPIGISNKIEGKVSGITRANGETFLLVGEQRIRLNEVSSIRDESVEAALKESKEEPVAGKMAGTETESNIAKSENKGPNVTLSDDVKKSLMSEVGKDRINPLMPLFMR